METISRRRFLTTAAGAAAGLAVGGPTLWVPPARAAVPQRGVHLGFGPDPRTTMTVSWSTEQAVAGARLEYGIDGSYGQSVVPAANAVPGVPNEIHHASLTGLEPGRTYQYRLSHGGGPATTGSFTTAPATGQRTRARRAARQQFRFATFGDMGVTAGAAANVATLLAAQPDLCFVVGDLCYADPSGGLQPLEAVPYDPAAWDAWLDQVAPSASGVPWMCTVGNHEMERIDDSASYPSYLGRFRPPANGPAPVVYSFRYANVGFVALDGNDVSAEITKHNGYVPGQDAWLETTLAGFRSDPTIEFVVVGFHNCMYCSNAVHGSDGGNRYRWEPIFRQYGVDLVVNGHNHCYERTHPLDGVTYLTVGGGGQAEYPTSTYPVSTVTVEGGARVPETAEWSAVRFQQYSVAIADVAPGTMRVRAYDKARAVIDDFTLSAR